MHNAPNKSLAAPTKMNNRGLTLLSQAIVPDYRLPLFQELKRRMGDRFCLACGQEGFATALQTSAAAHSLRVELRNRYLFSRRLLWQQGLMEKAMAADLLIIEFSLRTISTWLVLARRAAQGKPTVMWGHAAGRSRRMDWLKRWMFRRCQGFVAYTQSQADRIKSEFPPLLVWAAPNAVMWRRECYFEPQAPDLINGVIYVGRLVAEKKPRLLVEGFAQALRAGLMPTAATLLFVGDGPERVKLQDIVRTVGLTEKIKFAGHVSDIDQLRTLYRDALFSVSPGNVGLSATQSFSFGVPMLIADNEPHGPEIEACREGENTVFFSANGAEALVRGMGDLFRDKALWLGRRDAICHAAGEKYSLDAMADIFESVADTLLPGPRIQSPGM